MSEESNSWIRRTKFSHTVCHRLDSSTRLGSFPLNLQSDRKPDRSPGSKSRSTMSSASNQKKPDTQIQPNLTTDKQRSISPVPQTVLSDTFKEARSERRRSSTPTPQTQRKESEKRRLGKFFHKESRDKKGSGSPAPASPLTHLGSLKIGPKVRKESPWTKYFDHAGGRVNAVEADDGHMVDLSQLFLGVRFAHGAHSRLYHGIYKEEAVAVKIIRVPDDDHGDMAATLETQFNREFNLLSRLHHQNIIKFIAACRKPPVYCVITEYLSEGSLRAYLHKLDEKSLPLKKLIGIGLEIARGMEYIHSQGIIHRDLKPENVLIDQEFHMKIADFGIACEEAYCDLLVDDPGTYRWMAPEMIKKKSYGRKVDVYSFGLMLSEMVAGTIPYEDMNPIQAAFAVVNKKLRPVIPQDCPPAMRALIEQCWALNPEKRPEFWQIVKVLEQFESSIKRDGTLKWVPNPSCQDHKKGLLHWIQKLGPIHNPHSIAYTSPMLKPKFS